MRTLGLALTSGGATTLVINTLLASVLWTYGKASIQVALAILGLVSLSVGLGILRGAHNNKRSRSNDR